MKLTKYKLGDIADISAGGDAPKNYTTRKTDENTIPIYSNGVENEGLYGYTNYAKITKPAFTISARGTIGISFRRYTPYVPIVRLLSIVPTSKVVDLDYLYYYSKTILFRKDGSVQQQLTVPMLANIEVELPDLDTQRRIASVLSNLDRKIALNRHINTNLEALARQLYDYWFVQFDFPDANGNPYKSSGGKMTYNEKLKRHIPDGWDYLTTDKITNVITGKEDANFSVPNGKYPFFTCSRDNLRCATPAFSGKAVLIAGNGEFNVKHYTGEFNAYQRTYVLIPDDEKYYGVLYFASLEKIDLFKAKSNGSIIKFITKGDVENIGVFDCHKPEIYQQINTLIETIENNEREIASLTRQRDELLPLLMNGQVSVE